MEHAPTNELNCRDPSYNEFYLNSWDKMKKRQTFVYEYWFDNVVVGIVTVTMDKMRIDLDGVEISYPALLLGRIAVNQEYTGISTGSEMIDFIIALADKLSNEVGCRLIMLHVDKIRDESGDFVINQRLVNWYYDNGFDFSSYQPRKSKSFLYFDLLN